MQSIEFDIELKTLQLSFMSSVLPPEAPSEGVPPVKKSRFKREMEKKMPSNAAIDDTQFLDPEVEMDSKKWSLRINCYFQSFKQFSIRIKIVLSLNIFKIDVCLYSKNLYILTELQKYCFMSSKLQYIYCSFISRYTKSEIIYIC